MFPTKPRLSGRGAPPTFPDKFKITVYLLLSGDQPKVDAREILMWDIRAREGLRQGCASMGITPESYPELFDEDGYIYRLPSRRTLDRCAEKYPELSLMQSAVRKSAVDGAIHANILNGENSDPTWENVLYQDGTVLRPATSNTVPNTIDQNGNVRPARTCARVGEFIEGGQKGTRHGVKVVMTHARTPDYKQSFVTGFDFLHTMDPEAEIAQAVTLAEKFLTDLKAKNPQSRALALVSDGAGKGEAHRRLAEQGIALINLPPPMEAKKDRQAGISKRIREYEYTVNLATLGVDPPRGFRGEIVALGGDLFHKSIADGEVRYRPLKASPRYTRPRGKRTYLYLEVHITNGSQGIVRLPMHQARLETPEQHHKRMSWMRAYTPNSDDFQYLAGVRQSSEGTHSAIDRKLPFKVFPAYTEHSQNWHIGMHLIFRNLRARTFL